MQVFFKKIIKIFKTTADGETVIDAYPRIMLTNSHDGFNSFKFIVASLIKFLILFAPIYTTKIIIHYFTKYS